MVFYYLITFGFVCANILWVIMLINNNFLDYAYPIFINSSYHPNKPREEIESILLKSIYKQISPHLPQTLNNEFHLNLNSSMTYLHTENELKKSNFTKYSIYLNQLQNEIYVLKIVNDKIDPDSSRNKYGEVSLFSVSIESFLSSNNKDINSLLVKKCWSSVFYGRIIGAVSSSDKLNLAIFYRVLNGNDINFRIRFFHNTVCENMEIENGFRTNSFLEKFVQKKNEKEGISEIYQLYEENLIISSSPNENCELKKELVENFFDFHSFDDFSLQGNRPLSAMSIKRNTIAFSRDYDNRQFYILKRENDLNKTYWKVSYLGPKINKQAHPFLHTNSLKFLYDDVIDYKILQIFISANSSTISITSNIVKANHTEYNLQSINSDENHTVMTFSQTILDDKIIPNNEDFNSESLIKNMKNYMKPTVYSNNIKKNLIFEFVETSMFSLDWSKIIKKHSIFESMYGSLNGKIEKISSDFKNENVVVVLEENNENENKEFLYMWRDKRHFQNKSIIYEYINKLSFKKLPKIYRKKRVVAFSVNQIRNKTILLLLLENGIIVSSDLTKYNRKTSHFIKHYLVNDVYSSVMIIFVVNVITIAAYSRYFRTRNPQENNIRVENRNREINNVINDIIRINQPNREANNNVQNNPEAANNIEPINFQQPERENNVELVNLLHESEVIMSSSQANNDQIIQNNLHEKVEEFNEEINEETKLIEKTDSLDQPHNHNEFQEESKYVGEGEKKEVLLPSNEMNQETENQISSKIESQNDFLKSIREKYNELNKRSDI